MQVLCTVLALALIGFAAGDGHMDDGHTRLEAGQCHTECASGYTSSIGGSHDLCDDTITDHMFSLQGCDPICVNPGTAGYDSSSCNTARGAIRADECVIVCAAGYRRTVSDAAPTATCASGYGTFEFDGCEAEPECDLPTTTTGYDTQNCAASASNLLTEAQCSVTCATDYAGSPMRSCPSGGGNFIFTGCNPACDLPASNAMAGYVGCTSGQSEAQCQPNCATDYTGDAVDTCTTAGGEFSFSGCTALPKCKKPDTHVGYIPANCGTAGSPVTIDSCSVTCADGYEQTVSGTAPTDACSADDADFTFSGCTKIPACSMTTPQTGYDVTGCDTSAGNKMESECVVTCDTNNDYTGNPVVACPADEGAFSVTGCDAIPTCFATAPEGYTLGSCGDASTAVKASACSVTCDNDYSGSNPQAACPSMGGQMTFSGCYPECTLPSPMTTGYTGACAGSAPQREDQCGAVICDAVANYIGDAVVTCASAGGAFTLSGCSMIQTCELPESAAGYLWKAGCNPGRVNTYGIPESECNVQCAPGYHGQPEVTCSNGVFQFAGCMPGDGCDLPESTTGYRTELCTLPECTASGASEAFAIDAGSCQVGCAVGYAGMNPSAECDIAGGDFALSGCETLCVLPVDTSGYDTTACLTTAGAITAGECTISCASGYQLKAGMSQPTATCSTGFGVFAFDGCEMPPTCTLPATFPGYSHNGGCSGTLTEAQCIGVTCDTPNYAGSASVTCTSSGTFSLSGCDMACTLPDDTTGYDIGSCTGSTNSDQCEVSCDTSAWYTGDSPTDTCTSAGGEHSFSGCALEPKCTNPQTIGYTTSGCGDGTSSVWNSQCTVSCDTPAYTGQATKSCTGDGQPFTFGGCDLVPKCTAPSSSTMYTFAGCADEIYASACNAECASGYAGTPVPTCASNQGIFSFTGCEATCNLPATLPTGHTAGTCSAQRGDAAVAACSIACTEGYYADMITATCPSSGGTLIISGCTPIPTCTLTAESHLGYDVSGCNPGRGSTYGITESECAVTCATGYTGNAIASCSSSGTFTFSGCERLPECVLPSSTLGYETSRCNTAVDCSWARNVGGTVQQGVSATIVVLSAIFCSWSIQI